MAWKLSAPTITKEPDVGGRTRDRIEHEAFGLVEVSRTQIGGRGEQLFDSALNHHSTMNITIKRAVQIRDLYSSRIHAGLVKDTVCEIKLSEAQWASLVSSVGIGAGTPCTFRSRREGDLIECDGIDNAESIKDTHAKAVKEQLKKYTIEAATLVKDIEALVSSGKAGKGQLQELLSKAQTFSNNFAGNMGFAQEILETAMEKTVSDGKAEVEAFAIGTVQRLGMQKIAELNAPTLANDSAVTLIEDHSSDSANS